MSAAEAAENAPVPAPLTKAPDVMDVAPVPPFATGRVPVTPVVKGKPVVFVNVPEAGVPSAGVTNVGLVAKTKAPEPVSSVTAAAKLADEGVVKNVATPEPSPETPVAIGKPVQLVSVPEAGVPNTPPFTTGAPAEPTLTPKAVATPVPRPDTPVEIGKPVQLVKVPEVGVPSAGVTRVGLVANTKEPEPVSSDTAAAKFALEGVAKNVATPEPKPETPVEIGSPVQLVNVPEDGVPSAGVTSVGDVIVPPAIVGEIRWVFCWATFVPSLHTVIVLPAGIATVVPPLSVVPFLAVELETVAT